MEKNRKPATINKDFEEAVHEMIKGTQKETASRDRFKFRVWDFLAGKMREWDDILYLPVQEIFPGTPKQKEYDVMRFTGQCDIDGKEVYEGDILECVHGTMIVIQIKYGTYKAYCPADAVFMDSVGFYASAAGYPDMPIGAIEEYGRVIGNIYASPELLNKGIEETSE